MNASETIRHRIAAIPKGTPFTSTQMLSAGTRALVDQTLSRMVRQGELRRVSRGTFVRPKPHPLLGERPIDIESVLRLKAEGELLISGTAAQHRFGLTQQVPVRPTYYTTGPSRTVRIERLVCRLIHRSNSWFAFGTGPVGQAATALRSLGPARVTTEVVAQIERSLAPAEFAQLIEQRWRLPAWLARALGAYAAVQRMDL